MTSTERTKEIRKALKADWWICKEDAGTLTNGGENHVRLGYAGR